MPQAPLLTSSTNPGIGPGDFADVGNNSLGDIPDDLDRLVLRQLALEYLDCDKQAL
jgi:hypothetical protein